METRDLPACSAVPKSTATPRAPEFKVVPHFLFYDVFWVYEPDIRLYVGLLRVYRCFR